MAFKRSSFSSLKSTRKENFESIYKFSKKVKDFKSGDDVYVVPLGLETGYYETPCHRVLPHKVDGQSVGFGGSNYAYAVTIRCKGIDEEGNKVDALCCRLASKERERFPETDDYAKRLISSRTSKIHLPILILGNSINDPTKKTYPISKVSILNDLKTEAGLKFSYLEMSTSTFMNDIVSAYGKKLKEEGILDYELAEDSEEFFEEVRQRLINTVIKIHGVSKQGFNAALKEYSFFPFDNKAIASASPEGEREAIINYKDNNAIMAKVDEYLQLFNIEVDNLIRDWSEKDLQEYYNSATGVAIKEKQAEKQSKVEEKVEVITEDNQDAEEVEAEPVSDAEMEEIMADPFGTAEAEPEPASDTALDEFDFEMEEDEDFFGEE